MGYGTNGLTFNTLRGANTARLPEFKNAKGQKAHSKDDGSDWSPGEWVCAVTGELGELANIIKKVKRGDMSLEEARPSIAKELADVVTYLDILAMQLDVDLGQAVIDKFNEVSKRVKSSIWIDHEDWHRKTP
jgi:NTP pyrophosphatase (non-canonical NTP hydrolase)